MVEAQRVQFPDLVIAVAAVVLPTLVLFSPAGAFAEPVANDVTNPAIRDSAFWPVFFWALGCPIALAKRNWITGVRITWTLGCLLSLLHIAVAFHLGHGWSHEAAWEHTRQVGGYGDGIFVNYAFALVWLADVVWVWALPGSYLARPRRLNWTIHGFLAFVVVNAAVVFGSRESRAWFLYWFLVSLVATPFGRWYVRRRAAQESAARRTGGEFRTRRRYHR